MSKEQISYNYSTSEVLQQEIAQFDLTLESVEKELPIAEAKSEAFSKLISAVEYDLWEKVKRVNELVDEIKGFHETRLAGIGTDGDLNVILNTYNATIPLFPGLSPLNRATYDPNSSSNANDYLNDTLNKAAWFSNIGFTSSITGFQTTSEYDSEQTYNPSYTEEVVYSFEIEKVCNIVLNEDEHWDGTYKLDFKKNPDGNGYMSDDTGTPTKQEVPNLVCPTDEVKLGDGENIINKINIKIYGYDLEGINPVEVKESDLNEDNVGIGTFNVLQDIENRYDVGINTNNGVSFTYDGQSFSGDITEGSSNYNNYLKPKFDEITKLRSEITPLMNDINELKTLRVKSDLYAWSLKFSRNDTAKNKKERQDSTGLYDKYTEKYKDNLGLPEPQSNEVKRGKTFQELTEKEKKELSETYGLGIPKNIKVKLGSDKKPVKDPKTGEKLYVTDDGFNENYDEKKLKKFVEDNPGLTAFRDFTVTQSGSIIVIDSVGTATTFTGITTQINNITSGSMDSTNVGAGVSFDVVEFASVAGVVTSNVLKTPAAQISIAQTYSGTIGTFGHQWNEAFIRRIESDVLVGAATSVRTTSIASTTNIDRDIPVMLAVGANTEGISDAKPTVASNFTFNPSTGELSVGIISATELIVQTGTIGVATAANIEDGSSDTDGILLFTDFIGDGANILGDSGIRVNPSRNEIIASRFTGIISATDVNAGVTTLSQLEVTGVSTFTGDVSFGSTVTFGDDDRLKFGDFEDLQIYHDGSNSYITESGPGALRLVGDTVAIRNNAEDMAVFTTNAGVELYYDNSKKFETTGVGVSVYGNIDLGDSRIRIGVGTDLQIYHDGTNSYIEEGGTGDLIIKGDNNLDIKSENDELKARFTTDGAVELYQNNTKRFETTGVGVTVTGRIYASGSADFDGDLNITGVTTFGTVGAVTGNITTINSTTINNSGHLDSGFIDVGIVTANTGIITSNFVEYLSIQEQIFTSDGNTDVDDTFDEITISNEEQGRKLSDYDTVAYIAGSPGIGGLTDGQVYYVQAIGINTIKLYTDSGLVNLVNISPSGSDGVHTFRRNDVGIGTIEKFYSTSSEIKDVNVTGVATVAFSTTTDAYIGVVTTTSITIGSAGSSYIMPTVDGSTNQIISTDGSGTLSFVNPDIYGGNRIYVSDELGSDTNDGKIAPVKTIKKAAQIAASESYKYPVTILVAGGNYVEDNPIILADDVAVVGDNLRRVVVRPQNKLRDCFRVRNGNYITGLVFKDNVVFPTGAGVRHDILDQAGTYAKILVNGETGTATTYRTFIDPTITPIVAAGSTVGISSRIDDLIKLTKDSITDESTIVPTESSGNSDQEFTDAGNLIINNIGTSVGFASTAYIPGNAVGWSTSGAGGNYTLSDNQISDFEEDIHNIMSGIANDLRYGGDSGNEYTLEKIKNIVVGTPSFAFDYVISFDDPLDTATSRDGYIGLSSDKPRITQSPYIQNCSIISFLGANGANVDGSKIIQDNEPVVEEEAEIPFVGDVPDQGKSMVANAFTAVSFGGIGWKVSNAGYAQIVSCFQIFCQIGSYAQSGGYLSITNSATNFGFYALRANGFRAKAFEFDKGFIFSDGTDGANQTLRVGGLKRAEQDLYVLRFIDRTTGVDQTTNFKQSGVTTSLTSSGINTNTNRIDISGIESSLSDADGLLYIAPSNENQISGLVNDTIYYIDKVGAGTSAILYYDDELENVIDITDVPAGIHTFTKVAEEFFASEITESNNVYQNLTLSDAIGTGVTFVPGTSVSQTRSDDAVAVGFAVTWTSSVVTVSVENSINSDGASERVLFQTTATASAGSGDGTIEDENGTSTNINSLASRSDLFTINFKVDSTISGNLIQNITSLPKSYKCHLHRPSIINSSAHTWEYAGSGIDYNALPQNGGISNADFEQYDENGGRVFSSGTNELGDFKVGRSITAFNRTGNIDFQNKVTIGQLDSLELSLSGGVKITEISVSRELGNDEVGGPQDSRLPTQAAVHGYVVNKLGPFIDQNKSTAPIPSAIPQLNSQGLLDAGMIPAQIRFNNVFETNVSGGRTDLVNDIPALEVLKSDIVTEEYGEITNNFTLTFENEGQFLVLSSDTDDYAFNNGDEVTASQNNAVGIVTAPTHPSYGTTGLVKGVINSITVSAGGTGYNTAGIYSGVNLVSITGSGTSATADVTVNSLGEVENINIRRGGRYYSSGDTFRVDPNDIGGVDVGFTTFTATVDNVDTRLYLKLTGDKLQFFGSTSVPDFISDGSVASASTDFSTTYTENILPTSVGVGGSIYFSENSILIDTDTFDFDTGDPVLYTVSGGTVIGQLENNKTYFVKTVGVSSIQLSTTYDGDNIVTLDTSGTGTHQFKRLGVSTATDFVVFKDHGFETGKSVKYTTNGGPAGISTGSYYFVGSVTTNTFTLHDVRQDALNSINGSTINARDLTTVGSGIGTFDEQNVSFINTINTSSNNSNNFSILVSSADIDASNVISGVLEADRLATDGTASNLTFLRGDSAWEPAVQKIAVGVGTTSALTVSTLIPSQEIVGTGINTYYGNIRLDVTGITTEGVGTNEYAKIGVGQLRWKQDTNNFGPFKVTNSSHLIDLQSTSSGSNDNGIDAYTFHNQSLAQVVDLSNSTVNGNSRNILATVNGGTGVDNNAATQGQMLVCNTAGQFDRSSAPTLNGKLGLGFFSATASDVKGTLDIDELASHDTSSTTTTAASQTSIFSFDKSIFRTGKFIISVTDSVSNEYHSTEMLVIHDGTSAFKTEYASIFTSQLATFAVDVDGSNVRVLATPASANSTTFKVYASGLIRV